VAAGERAALIVPILGWAIIGPGQPSVEIADGLPHGAALYRQPLGTEEERQDGHDDDQLCGSYPTRH